MKFVQKNRIINQNGNVECDLNAAVLALNSGEDFTTISLVNVYDTEVDKYNQLCKEHGIDSYMSHSCEPNHEELQKQWVFDEIYYNFDLRVFFLGLCKTDIERERVTYELDEYEKFNMTNLLRCMVWLVNYMTEHEIFWGVGRGSSVSSYCLYLIKLHLVDSIKYDLDIHDFLKW